MRKRLLKLIDKADGKMQSFMSGFYEGWNRLVYKARRKAEGPEANYYRPMEVQEG